MGWKEIVGTNIRTVRADKDLSQEEIAHRVNISTTYYGQVERGTRNVTIEVLGRIADALGVEMERLIER
jgi:transcriptional regulator with XRE-family HTH domain